MWNHWKRKERSRGLSSFWTACVLFASIRNKCGQKNRSEDHKNTCQTQTDCKQERSLQVSAWTARINIRKPQTDGHKFETMKSVSFVLLCFFLFKVNLLQLFPGRHEPWTPEMQKTFIWWVNTQFRTCFIVNIQAFIWRTITLLFGRTRRDKEASKTAEAETHRWIIAATITL